MALGRLLVIAETLCPPLQSGSINERDPESFCGDEMEMGEKGGVEACV